MMQICAGKKVNEAVKSDYLPEKISRFQNHKRGNYSLEFASVA